MRLNLIESVVYHLLRLPSNWQLHLVSLRNGYYVVHPDEKNEFEPLTWKEREAVVRSVKSILEDKPLPPARARKMKKTPPPPPVTIPAKATPATLTTADITRNRLRARAGEKDGTG